MSTADDHRDGFLSARPRLAVLTTLRADGSPSTLPVWFDWDGQQVAMFCGADSLKLDRIAADARVGVLVANDIDEPEYWVSFEGEADVHAEGGAALAERLAGRYWDLSDPAKAETLDAWRTAGDGGLRLITLTPAKIRTYGD